MQYFLVKYSESGSSSTYRTLIMAETSKEAIDSFYGRMDKERFSIINIEQWS